MQPWDCHTSLLTLPRPAALQPGFRCASSLLTWQYGRDEPGPGATRWALGTLGTWCHLPDTCWDTLLSRDWRWHLENTKRKKEDFRDDIPRCRSEMSASKHVPSHLVAASTVTRRARARARRAGSGGRGHGRLPELHVLSVPQTQLSTIFKSAEKRQEPHGNEGTCHPQRAPRRHSALTAWVPPGDAAGPGSLSPGRGPPSCPSNAFPAALCSLFRIRSVTAVWETAADLRPLSPRGPSVSVVCTSWLLQASTWAVGCFFVVRLRTHCASQDMGRPSHHAGCDHLHRVLSTHRL